MTAIRHILIERFRGFDHFEVALRAHAVLVGEPGAGRSDLIEALIRVLDPDSLKARRAHELDIHGMDPAATAVVEVTLGDLSADVRSALFEGTEFWDAATESIITELPDGSDPGDFEDVIRLGYRLSFEEGQAVEAVYYPKTFDPEAMTFQRVPSSARELFPFFWQRGVSTKPLDLAGRGELRGLIDRQQGQDFDDALDAFMEAVETAAGGFSSQERVAAALTAVLEPLRSVRRFHPDEIASNLVRFLPDGGAPSGLLRSLAAAISLVDSPAHFPALRQGSTLLAALRGGVLIAAAKRAEGAIVAIDDLGGEFDPFLARHLAAVLRRSTAQLIASTHVPDVVGAFPTEEWLRLYRRDHRRQAARGKRPTSKAERVSVRYLSSALVNAVNASVLIVVEGHHDRLGYLAVTERAVRAGLVESFDGIAAVFQEAEGDGEIPKVVSAAKELGIFTIVILDNDRGDPAATDDKVVASEAVADAVIRLPARTALEDALLADIPSTELVAAFEDLEAALGPLVRRAGWQALDKPRLLDVLRDTLHNRTGSLHAVFVDALPDGTIPARALAVVQRAHEVAQSRATGLHEM